MERRHHTQRKKRERKKGEKYEQARWSQTRNRMQAVRWILMETAVEILVKLLPCLVPTTLSHQCIPVWKMAIIHQLPERNRYERFNVTININFWSLILFPCHQAKQKKRKRCGECTGCQKKDNCGECAPCRNDKSHQICKQRRCEKLTEKKVSEVIFIAKAVE